MQSPFTTIFFNKYQASSKLGRKCWKSSQKISKVLLTVASHIIFHASGSYLYQTHFCLQGTPVKDVVIPNNAPKNLLLQKHVDYIAAYGSKKDDYVSI